MKDGLKVWTLLQVPFHRFVAVRWLNRWLLWASIRGLMWRNGIHKPITWFMVPHVASLAHRLGESLCVYYCIDDYAAFPEVNSLVVGAMDVELTRRADIVFVASETLYESKRRLNSQAYMSPHGVDVDHFRSAQDESVSVPLDIAQLPHPIVGFFGLVEKWIDVELMAYLAQKRPQWTFLIIGRVAIPDSEVPRLPNMQFIGQRPYADLPAYGKQFDVAVIPYRINQQSLNANPLKLREYLAMGKPVVSVSTPEIEKLKDVVDIAYSREEFLVCLDAALARPNSLASIEQRIDRVATCSWDARLREVWRLIGNHVSGRDFGPHAQADSISATQNCSG